MNDPHFHILRGNSTEVLARRLVAELRAQEVSPFETITVLVQSPGMGTYLEHLLARELGVCAGVRFIFPENFLHELFSTVLGAQAGSVEKWQRERVFWAIMAELPGRFAWVSSYRELADYLRDDRDGMRIYQLCRRISRLFVGYLTFRPNMVTDWRAADTENWQADLYALVRKRLDSPCLADLHSEFVQWAQQTPSATPAPWSRIFVFGIPSLPPFFLRILAEFSRQVPVLWFALSPSREFWADLRSEREILREAQKAIHLTREALHLENRNPLLTSWGKLGREFQEILESAVNYQEVVPDAFVPVADTTMLSALKHDFLTLNVRTPETRFVVEPADRSLQIHSCHGPMRQVEVLRDVILGLLDADPTLQPRDIAVLTPGLDTFAPLIDAVFRCDAADPRYIPFGIADRKVRSQNPVVDALFRVLALVESRVTASEVLDLVANEAVRARLEMTTAGQDRIAEWVRKSGIRWGIDAAHRAEFGRTSGDTHSFSFGLRRMLLGYALPEVESTLFAGVLPYDEIEGEDAKLLGRFAEFCENVFATVRRFREPRRVFEWIDATLELLRWLVGEPDDEFLSVQVVRDQLEEIRTDATALGFDGKIGITVFRHLLDELLGERRGDRGFLGGGITFCALLPMRAVPFRVVCMLGMDHDLFPRPRDVLPFDLVSSNRQAGDRDPAMEDRYLFLECILCASDALIVTYTGRDEQENRLRPLAVVVEDLLDHADRVFAFPNEKTARQALITEHPAQPFGPRYFEKDSGVFTYQSEFLVGARAVLGQENLPESWWDGPLENVAPPTDLEIDDLVKFFEDPVGQFLKRTLQVQLKDFAAEIDDHDPVFLDALQEWTVTSDLLSLTRSKGPVSPSGILKARGRLPLGALGELTMRKNGQFAEALWRRAERILKGDVPGRVRGEVSLDGCMVRGVIRDVAGELLLLTSASDVSKGKRQIGPWVKHVFLNAAFPDANFTTCVLGRRKRGLQKGKPYKSGGERAVVQDRLVGGYVFNPPADARKELQNLVELFRIGLAEPLLLFPDASFEFAFQIQSDSDSQTAARHASRLFQPWGSRGPEDTIARVLGNADPFSWNFKLKGIPSAPSLDAQTLATRVFLPMLRCREEIK